MRFSETLLIVDLMDGRSISTPLSWYPRLSGADVEKLENCERCGAGYGIYWPDLDEHLSTEGMLKGRVSPRGKEVVGDSKIDPNSKQKSTEYEQDILDSVERGEWKSVDNLEAAKNTIKKMGTQRTKKDE